MEVKDKILQTSLNKNRKGDERVQDQVKLIERNQFMVAYVILMIVYSLSLFEVITGSIQIGQREMPTDIFLFMIVGSSWVIEYFLKYLLHRKKRHLWYSIFYPYIMDDDTTYLYL